MCLEGKNKSNSQAMDQVGQGISYLLTKTSAAFSPLMVFTLAAKSIGSTLR
jgi:hypothetical protein